MTTSTAYQSIVHELSLTPDLRALLGRLAKGHRPDNRGWCAHTSHHAHWVRHPCPTTELVVAVRSESRRASR